MLNFVLKQLNFFFLIKLNFLIEITFIAIRRCLFYIIFLSDFYLVFWFSVILWAIFFNLNINYFWNVITILFNTAATDTLFYSFFFLITTEVTNFLGNFYSFFLLSIKNTITVLNISQYNSIIVNPLKDIDLTINTDFEDLLAFLGDSLEFVEQDRAFFFDAIFDFYSVTGEFVSLMSIELLVLKNLKKLPQSAVLAKFFRI